MLSPSYHEAVDPQHEVAMLTLLNTDENYCENLIKLCCLLYTDTFNLVSNFVTVLQQRLPTRVAQETIHIV